MPTLLPATGDLAVVRDGDDLLVATEASEVLALNGPDALEALDGLAGGWWAGFLSYDLAGSIERLPDRSATRSVPDLLLARFERRTRLVAPPLAARSGERIPLESWVSSLNRAAYGDAVSRIHEHLLRGDCYQVNLTRRLSSRLAADPVSLYCALARDNPAPHAALLRIGDVAVVSASPERFLRIADGVVETRPIKGTSADPDALVKSVKDRAENVMIVDLARNDLGRVCAYGSVHVPAVCELEAHPGLYHLVSTVRGCLRPGVGVGEVVRATFPPASVTGCPKPRVLQIIDALEPAPRGVYCGAIGFIDADKGVVDLNVAIRTFTITSSGTSFGVGGGIVADSDAGAEWEETELKAQRLLAVAAGSDFQEAAHGHHGAERADRHAEDREPEHLTERDALERDGGDPDREL